MRRGAIKVETKGSFFWLDEVEMEYLRLPKHEGPRERAEWSDERAGTLQDAVWHPMTGWRIDTFPDSPLPDFATLLERYGRSDLAADVMDSYERRVGSLPGLMIDTPDGETTWAPDARIIEGAIS